MEGNNHRVRINASQDAKGYYKLECTAEFDSVEEAALNMANGLVRARAELIAQGLRPIADPM